MEDKVNIQETEEIVYSVFDHSHRGDFNTLKEAKEDYKVAKRSGIAELIKTRTRVIEIIEVKSIYSL